MSPPTVQPPPLIAPVSIALAAGTLGFAVNAFNPAVFGGVGMVFGGSFALMVAFALGPWWGLLAAAIASSRTLLAWGHPLGFVTFSLEAVVVGWLTTRHRWHPLRADVLFWGTIGFPAGLAFTWFSKDIPFPAFGAIAIKMPANGLLVALIALVATGILECRQPRLLGYRPAPTGSLRLFLFQRFGMLATLPIAALGLFVGHTMDGLQRTEAANDLAASAVRTAEDVRLHLDEHRRAIATVARQFELSGVSDPAAFAVQLEALRREYAGFLTLLVADDHGDIVATVANPASRTGAPPGAGLSVADRDYFKQAVATKRSFVSDVFVGRGLGQDLIVAISAPVLNGDGRVRWVVEGSLNLRRMTDAIGLTDSTKDRDLLVTDRNHRVVCSTAELTLPALTSLTNHSLYFAAREGERSAFAHDQPHPALSHPERQLASAASVPGYGWSVYLQEPIWRTQQSIASFYLTLLLGSMAAVGAALLLARGTATVVTGPLQRLLESAHALAQMSPTVPALDQANAPAEIAQLSGDVHLAALRLNQNNAVLERTNEELRELARTLDRRVHERTADLEEARAQAESANRAKSEFLASMSHELRTPLSVILGNTSLLEDGVLGQLPDRQRESVRAIEESGQLLLSLINDILDLSKVEAGMLELDCQEMGATDVCEASLRLIRGAAAKKGLVLETHYDCPADATFIADARRVKQILVNLLSNAVKFTPAGGRISVGVAIDAEVGAINFRVTDTGIGIALDRQHRLFRPFVQIDSRLSRDYSGTGLGLALVKRLADLHDGGVTLVSEPGHGSTFTVALPLHRETASHPPLLPRTGGAPSEPIAGNPRILVAEDSATNIAVLRAFFHAQACQPVFARDGAEAIERAFAARPDIILMDVQMPRMDGLEAIRRLRADARTAAVPIVCLTALAMADDRDRCLAAGANDFLCKPINFRALSATINRLVGEWPQPPEPIHDHVNASA